MSTAAAGNLPAQHHVPFLVHPPALTAGFSDPSWATVPALTVAHFHARSSAHHPLVEVRIAASATHLHCCWRVADAQVLSRVTEPNGSVCGDSCVEIFFSPPGAAGYFNLEINAGGTRHCSYITDCTLTATGFAALRFIAPDDLARIQVRSTLPQRIDAELPGPVTWELAVAVPFALLSEYTGQVVAPAGTWRANLYKCADHSSTPHWASWSPIGERLAFHQPHLFGFLHLP